MVSNPIYRNHAMCDSCWEQKNPGRTAYRLMGSVRDTCCYCGGLASGIYVRDRVMSHCSASCRKGD